MILRSDDVNASFARYAAFVRNNPAWPSVGMIRRRAEGQMWQQKLDAGTVFAFFATSQPTSTLGRLAMARAALTQGDRAAAQKFVREAWRNDSMSDDLETQVVEMFGELLTRADHKARMDIRLYAEDSTDGLRAAQRLGGNELAIAKARIAVTGKASNAGALLESVPKRSAFRPRLHLQSRPVAAPQRSDQRGRAGAALGAEQSSRHPRYQRVVDRAQARRPQAPRRQQPAGGLSGGGERGRADE